MLDIQNIEKAQRDWANAVIRLGELRNDPLNLPNAARALVDNLYDYGEGEVLFKPTKALRIPFRKTREAAISYFIGANTNFPEDAGFALKPWISVEFENSGIRVEGNNAAAMGHYFFTDEGGIKLKVEYSFAYRKNPEGQLKIWLHHSSLPFSG